MTWMWLKLIGYAPAALSMFNLLQKFYGFGVRPLMVDLIRFYQSLTYPMVQWAVPYLEHFLLDSIMRLCGFLGLPPPQSIDRDLLIVYLIIGASRARMHRFPSVISAPAAIVISLLSLMLWPATAMIALFYTPIMALVDGEFHVGTIAQSIIRGYWAWMLEIIYACVALIIFFAMNAYGPSL